MSALYWGVIWLAPYRGITVTHIIKGERSWEDVTALWDYPPPPPTGDENGWRWMEWDRERWGEAVVHPEILGGGGGGLITHQWEILRALGAGGRWDEKEKDWEIWWDKWKKNLRKKMEWIKGWDVWKHEAPLYLVQCQIKCIHLPRMMGEMRGWKMGRCDAMLPMELRKCTLWVQVDSESVYRG